MDVDKFIPISLVNFNHYCQGSAYMKYTCLILLIAAFGSTKTAPPKTVYDILIHPINCLLAFSFVASF